MGGDNGDGGGGAYATEDWDTNGGVDGDGDTTLGSGAGSGVGVYDGITLGDGAGAGMTDIRVTSLLFEDVGKLRQLVALVVSNRGQGGAGDGCRRASVRSWAMAMAISVDEW
jgi:hypothetical protein